ncbi:hypothetical protein KJ359_000916 [Pestalotiopsis sp. 9143b]|nr:hypothetical protein KJ359_000916 [Pestalotiopsis sp. 9143b]
MSDLSDSINRLQQWLSQTGVGTEKDHDEPEHREHSHTDVERLHSIVNPESEYDISTDKEEDTSFAANLDRLEGHTVSTEPQAFQEHNDGSLVEDDTLKSGLDLSNSFRRCIGEYRSLLFAISGQVEAEGTLAFERMLEEYGRLKLWGDQNRALLPHVPGSLSYVLRDQPEMLDTTRSTFKRLGQSLESANVVVTKGPVLDLDKLNSLDEDSESDLSSGSETSEGLSEDSQAEEPLYVLLRRIYDQIGFVFQLGSLIRDRRFHDRYLHSGSSHGNTSVSMQDDEHIRVKLDRWKNSEDTENHMTAAHQSKGIWNATQISILTDMGEEPQNEASEQACHFCLRHLSLKQMPAHVADHMEELSLFSLPNVDFEEDASTGDDSQSLSQDPAEASHDLQNRAELTVTNDERISGFITQGRSAIADDAEIDTLQMPLERNSESTHAKSQVLIPEVSRRPRTANKDLANARINFLAAERSRQAASLVQDSEYLAEFEYTKPGDLARYDLDRANPTPQFPGFPRQAAHKGTTARKVDSSKKEVPPGARWTKINRRLVNPEALTIGKERFEVRDDFIIVLRVLSKEEIQAYATATAQLRGKYYGDNCPYRTDSVFQIVQRDTERQREPERETDRERVREGDRVRARESESLRELELERKRMLESGRDHVREREIKISSGGRGNSPI